VLFSDDGMLLPDDGHSVRSTLPVGLGCCLLNVLLAPRAADWVDRVFGPGVAPDAPFEYVGAAYFLLAYTALLIGWRALQTGPHSFLETIWACNQSMIMAATGMLTSRPLLVAAAVAAVAGDQIAWYADVIGYLASGGKKFPIGVAKYLTYPENRALSKRLTSSHHVWFIPLCLWVLAGHGGMAFRAYYLSCLFTSSLAVWARFFTPKILRIKSQKEGMYMNINGAYEFWKDIKVPFLHVLDNRHPLLYLPFLFVTGNLSVNLLPFGLLSLCSTHFG